MGLINSRPVSRKSPMKGIKAIAFAPYSASDPVLNTVTGVVELPAGMTTPPAIARVEVRATGNNVTETSTFDEATRTSEFVGALTVFIPGNDDALGSQLSSLSGILQTVFIEDYNGVIKVLGSKNGCDVMTLVGGTDLQGYTVTIGSKEVDRMYTLAPAGVTDYLSGLLPTL